MAFAQSTTNSNKNQFVASLTSKNSGKVAIWLNPADSFIKSTTGEDMSNVTPEMIEKLIKAVLESGNFELVVKDTTKEIEVVDPTLY